MHMGKCQGIQITLRERERKLELDQKPATFACPIHSVSSIVARNKVKEVFYSATLEKPTCSRE